MATDFGFGNLAGTGLDPSSVDGYNFEGLGNYDYSGVNDLSTSFNFDSLDSSGLGTEYGFGGPSTGVYGNPAHPNTTGFQQTLSGVNDFFSKNAFGKIANVALNFTPIGRAFNVARGVATQLGQGNPMGAAGAAMGAVPGPVGMVGNFLNAANSGKGGNLASMFGGMVGNAAGGPLGGLAGSNLGQQLAGMQGPTSVGGANFAQDPSQGYGLEQGISDAMKLYAMSQGSSGFGAAKDANNAIQGQISQLSSMYGPNSPYAQQLRQQLERKDAAAGRRSQYGPREVQLQAALADKAAQTAGTIGNLAQQSQTQSLALKNAKDQQRAQQLAMLFKMGQGSGVFNKLGNMFETPQPMNDNYSVLPANFNYGDMQNDADNLWNWNS